MWRREWRRLSGIRGTTLRLDSKTVVTVSLTGWMMRGLVTSALWPALVTMLSLAGVAMGADGECKDRFVFGDTSSKIVGVAVAEGDLPEKDPEGSVPHVSKRAKLAVALEDLGRYIDSVVPYEWDQAEWISGDGNGRIVVRYYAWRDPIKVRAGGRRSVTGAVRMYYLAEGGMAAIGGRVTKIGSCGTAKDPRVVEVAFETTIADRGNRVVTKTSIGNVRMINRCEGTLLRLDFSSRIRERLLSVGERVARVIDDSIEGLQ